MKSTVHFYAILGVLLPAGTAAASGGACHPHQFFGDSWSPANAPAGCGDECKPVQYFHWLKDESNFTSAALEAKNATDFMPYAKTLFSWTYHRGIEDSPADNIFPPGQTNCSSKYSTFTGVWWDTGVSEVRRRFEQFFGNYSAIGGELDRFVIDAEIWLSNWPLFDNPGPSTECKQQRALYIQRDQRWPEIKTFLQDEGMVFNESQPDYLWQSIRQSSNYHVWNTYMLNRTATYFNLAIWEVIAQHYPGAQPAVQAGSQDHRQQLAAALTPHRQAAPAPVPGPGPAQSHTPPTSQQGPTARPVPSPLRFGPSPFASSVSLSNYEYMLWNTSRTGCVPDRNGNPYCQDGFGAVQGNVASPSLYMGFSGSGGLRDYLRNHFNLSGSYPQTPYNAMRWNVMQHRSLSLSSMAPNLYSDTKDILIRPWVAFKTFSGSLTNSSDYYQEALLHFLLAGSDDLNFWNPDELMHSNDTSNLEFARALNEASWAAGCDERAWAWPDPRDPAVARGREMLAFDRPVVVTGMSGVPLGGTIYRVTTAGGPPSQFQEEEEEEGAPSGNKGEAMGSPLVFKVPPSSGDGGGASASCTVSFPQGKVVHPPGSVPPASKLGAWVLQPEGAAAPTMQCA